MAYGPEELSPGIRGYREDIGCGTVYYVSGIDAGYAEPVPYFMDGGWAVLELEGRVPDVLALSEDWDRVYGIGWPDNMPELRIPSSVRSIHPDAARRVGKVTVSGSNPCYESYGGGVYTKGRDRLVLVPEGCVHLTVPRECTCLSGGCLMHAHGLRSVEVEAGNGVFASEGGFVYARGEIVACCADGDVHVPEGTRHIGREAFAGRIAGTVRIPRSVETISEGAFVGCEAASIEVDPSNPHYTDVDGVLFDRSGALAAFPSGSPATEYTVPPHAREVLRDAFWNVCLDTLRMNAGPLVCRETFERSRVLPLEFPEGFVGEMVSCTFTDGDVERTMSPDELGGRRFEQLFDKRGRTVAYRDVSDVPGVRASS